VNESIIYELQNAVSDNKEAIKRIASTLEWIVESMKAGSVAPQLEKELQELKERIKEMDEYPGEEARQ